MKYVSNSIKQKIEDVVNSSGEYLYKISDYQRIDYNYGITCVKYKKKLKSSKHSLQYPSARFIFRLFLPLSAHNSLQCCYFDTVSEAFLGETQNETAETIQNKGLELTEKGKFAEAKVLFNKALSISANNDPNQNFFVQYIDAMDFAMDGINYLKDGQFMGAIEKFQGAYNIFCEVREICSKFTDCKKAAYSAYEALYLAIRRRYNEASEKFEKAQVQLNIDEIKIYFFNYKETVDTIIDARKLLTEERIKDAEERLCAALKITSCIVINKIIVNELDNVRRKGKENAAAKLYEDGTVLWNEAWTAENNQNANNASRIFQSAKNKFEEAYSLIQNSEFNKWILIVEYKIKGNELFNIGMEQQEMGNDLNECELYQNAYNTYEKSKNCFQEGYNLGDDQRFMSSIEFVEKYKNETMKVIQNMPTNTQVANLTFINDRTYCRT